MRVLLGALLLLLVGALASYAEDFFTLHPCDRKDDTLMESLFASWECHQNYPPIEDKRSGNDAYVYCGEDGDAQVRLDGYLAGMVIAIGESRLVSVGICLPPAHSSTQVKDVYCKYLALHPETRHLHWRQLWSEAMLEAFPCR